MLVHRTHTFTFQVYGEKSHVDVVPLHSGLVEERQTQTLYSRVYHQVSFIENKTNNRGPCPEGLPHKIVSKSFLIR